MGAKQVSLPRGEGLSGRGVCPPIDRALCPPTDRARGAGK